LSRSRLGEFGIVPPTIVRQPATTNASIHLCAECGAPVEGTKGSHLVRKPVLVDDEISACVGDELVVYGFVCARHRADVVHPLPTNADAGNVNSGHGWTGVHLEFSDGVVRWVAVPEAEVDA